jgi:hypothetical protein
MMVGFLQSIEKDIHIRVENLCDFQIDKLEKDHKYPNCFSGGCWIIDVSRENYGKTITDNNIYYLDNSNIFSDEIKNINYENY